MKKLVNYPCSKCKKLTNGTLIAYQEVNERLTVVRFKKDCCSNVEVKYFTPFEKNRYIKEV